ncbi:unnamed protein product [marine sediment metagenome]|uniref:Uncharacterized protein n=1 Tax=marine sediment metagenome TaxID=412755 RepID=X1E094_9ZZZZ
MLNANDVMISIARPKNNHMLRSESRPILNKLASVLMSPIGDSTILFPSSVWLLTIALSCALTFSNMLSSVILGITIGLIGISALFAVIYLIFRWKPLD